MRVDLHMHTGYSADAAFPQSVEDKVRACCAAGLEIIGITDHLDFYRTRGPVREPGRGGLPARYPRGKAGVCRRA